MGRPATLRKIKTQHGPYCPSCGEKIQDTHKHKDGCPRTRMTRAASFKCNLPEPICSWCGLRTSKKGHTEFCPTRMI